MSEPQNAAVLALLSVLEQRAKKKGQKSIVKGMLRALADRGAGEDLIADVAALNTAKSAPAKAKAAKAEPKSSARAERSAKAKTKAKPKVAAKKKAADGGELAA